MNIFLNYIPNEFITINDRDPPWITSVIKNKIIEKNTLNKKYLANGRKAIDLDKVNEACNLLSILISESKDAYYNRLSNKLKDPKTSPKAYWSILKYFFANKKVPIIPPIIYNNEIITNFKAKAEIFNTHFANQCSLINNSSNLPNIPVISQVIGSLTSIQIDGDQILKLIRSLDINKSHGFDQISARMLKICDSSVVKPLLIIFKNSVNEGVFPTSWKKANVTPIHKKGKKNYIANYRPISVLPICGKIFEKILYSAIYTYFQDNDIFNVNQSGFRAGDSCINQLVSITHDIFHSFDANPSLEVRGVFLDISKAFDRVWHKGILFKLELNGVSGKVLKLIESFLENRYQRVILNGQCSSWETIKAGVPQGSILGPLLFLIYINDISNGLESNVKLFADDTSIFSIVFDPSLSANKLNNDLKKIQQWAFQWKMIFNPDPSKQAQEVVFSKKRNQPNHPDLYFNELKVKRVSAQKHLGLVLDEKLNFNLHLKTVTDKIIKSIGVLRKLRFYVPRHSLITIYKSFIRSQLEYADVIYDQPSYDSFSDRLESIQYNSALAITGAVRGTSKEKIYNELGLEYLSSRRWFKRLCLFYKIVYNKTPAYLRDIIPKQRHFRNTRNQYMIPQFFCRTDCFSNSFFPYSIREWNKLDRHITQINSFQTFRNTLLKSIRPVPNSIFDACDPLGIQLLTRLRLGLSHLQDHKFKHGFNDVINPFCQCNMEIESVSHFYLRCPNFSTQRNDLMNELHNVNSSITDMDHSSLTDLLLFGNKSFTKEVNSKILEISIKFIKETERFDGPLF